MLGLGNSCTMFYFCFFRSLPIPSKKKEGGARLYSSVFFGGEIVREGKKSKLSWMKTLDAPQLCGQAKVSVWDDEGTVQGARKEKKKGRKKRKARKAARKKTVR